ncbi:MAG TPA: tetratricopeptide repeat protein [Chryseolinea sp.]|nr:tetratricopeptide repeat protein [Chryseolinea sp.]
MKFVFGFVLLFSMVTDPTKIAEINRVKKEARSAYTSGDYAKAIEKYKYLSDSLQVTEDEIMLNLANAYFLTKDTASAYPGYQMLTNSSQSHIKSKAFQQLGILNHQKGKFEEALNQFKQAIKANTQNADARYNYEALKRKLDEKKKQDEQKKKDDQNKKQEPSEYAKKLKAQAEALAAQFRFEEAHNLMMEGAKKDQTVMYFKDFIDRLNDVITINKK